MSEVLNAATVAMAALLLAVWLLLWRRALRRWQAGAPLLTPVNGPPVVWGLVDVVAAVFLQGLALIVAAKFIHQLFGIDLSQAPGEMNIDERAELLLASPIAQFLAFLLTILWLVIRHRTSASDLGFDVRRLKDDIVIGAVAFVMLAPIVYGLQAILVQLIESKHPLLELLKEDPSPRFFAISGIAAVLVAPLTEEIQFRLLLQGWLARAATERDTAWGVFFGGRYTPPTRVAETVVAADAKPSPDEPATLPAHRLPTSAEETQDQLSEPAPRHWWPVAVSSLLFSLAHAQHGPDPIPLFVLAFGLGYLYRQTHRIVPSIVVHVLLNSCTLVMLWLSVKQPA